MKELEIACFDIITNVGTAKSLYHEALSLAKEGDFDGAYKLIEEGEQSFLIGHKAHANLVQKEANGEDLSIKLILIHSEDQLMGAEQTKEMVIEFIELYKLILSK